MLVSPNTLNLIAPHRAAQHLEQRKHPRPHSLPSLAHAHPLLLRDLVRVKGTCVACADLRAGRPDPNLDDLDCADRARAHGVCVPPAAAEDVVREETHGPVLLAHVCVGDQRSHAVDRGRAVVETVAVRRGEEDQAVYWKARDGSAVEDHGGIINKLTFRRADAHVHRARRAVPDRPVEHGGRIPMQVDVH